VKFLTDALGFLPRVRVILTFECEDINHAKQAKKKAKRKKIGAYVKSFLHS
jgi:hypothetical protein